MKVNLNFDRKPPRFFSLHNMSFNYKRNITYMQNFKNELKLSRNKETFKAGS